MPIPIAEFEAAPTSERYAGRDPRHAETVRAFLREYPDEAFTLSEIRSRTGVPRGCVGTVLVRLNAYGAVRHRGSYWATARTDRDNENRPVRASR